MLVKMVKKNAMEILEKSSQRIKKQISDSKEALVELQELLGLENIPNRIEAYDISNIQGVESVGSMVVFENGLPSKSNYRRFRIKTVIGPNDYKSMEEIIDRRINRGISELGDSKSGFNRMPDLMLIEIGRAHV